MRLGHYGTPARVRATPSTYPDPSTIRRFVRFVGDLQRKNGGQPVITTAAEIERATGVTQPEQIRVRQTLMSAGVLRLSAIGNDWAYHLEARS